MMRGDEPCDKVAEFLGDAAYAGLEDGKGGGEFVAKMSAALEGFTFGVAFAVMLPCAVWRFRDRCVCFAFEAEAMVEFDLRLEGFVRFAEVMPTGGDGQSGADYPGFLEDRLQFSAHIVGVLGDGLPIPLGYGVLFVAVGGASCGSQNRCDA